MAKYTPETYFLNPAHEEIVKARYYLKDQKGECVEKNVFETFKRVNDYIYQDDLEHKDIAQRLCEEKKIMYAGRPLAQAGTGIKNMFNCFVLGIDDSREEISECQRIHFHIQAHGGGTGINFSKLRPSGAWCKGANARSSGPEGFITAMGYLSSNIQQGGNRSGANMGILEDWHPGLLKFITKKSRSNWENIRKFAVVTNENQFKQWQWMNPYSWQTFNVSVALSDDFMRQVKRKSPREWKLRWKDEEWGLWDYQATLKDRLPNGDIIEDVVDITVCAPDEEISLHEALAEVPFRNKEQVGLELKKGFYHITAFGWFEKICTNTWEDGCPGIFFIDKARAYHNGEYFNPVDAPNPCAEQILPQWSVCCLASIVLPEFVTESGDIDWVGLREAVGVLLRSLNHITQLNHTGVEQIDTNALRERRIGLGTIGIHELLIRVSARKGEDYCYSSEEGRSLTGEVLKFIKHAAYESSIEMAKEIGPFPDFDYEGLLQSKFIQRLIKERPDIGEAMKEHGIANVTILTQAPTGTTGTATGYSSGCEPYFSMAYIRHSNVGSYMDGCPSFREWLGSKDIDFADYGHNLKELRRKFKRVPKYFEEAQDISWENHLAMQAVFAEQVDSSVSKCLAAGTLINTNKGLIPIEQCGNAQGEDTFGKPLEDLTVIDEQGNHQKVISHYSAGEKEATRLTLQNGASIFGARYSHKVKTIEGWKTLEELTPSDLVFVNDDFEVFDVENALPINVYFDRKTNANLVNLPDRMSVYLSKLLGMLAADGHLEEATGKVSLYEKSPGVGGFYDSLAKELFGITPEIHIDNRTEVVEHRITSRVLVRYLRELIGYRSEDKQVPDQILQGSFAEKRHFLEGLTLDGYLREGRGLVVYEGKSQKLAYQSAELLRSFGKPHVYCGKKWVKTHNYYVHSVVVSEELQSIIAPLELHKCDRPSYRKRDQLVVFDSEDLMILPIPANHMHYSAVRNLRQRNLNYCTQSLAKRVGLRSLGKVEKISTIEHLGTVPMYDIEVDKAHNYLVSGIVSHNTINLPNNATVGDIMGAYIRAYDLDIKSTAIYRDGSKAQILETLKGTQKRSDHRPHTILTVQSPGRGKELPCDIHTVSVKGERWKVLVGLLYDRPYETFCFPEEQIEIPASKTEGIMVRADQGKYNLIIGEGDNRYVIKNIASQLLNDEHRMITRLLSANLRHGTPLSAVVSQLTKCDGEVTAFSKAMMRVLRKYISDEEFLEISRCQACGSTSLVLNGGCLGCADCGMSACD